MTGFRTLARLITSGLTIALSCAVAAGAAEAAEAPRTRSESIPNLGGAWARDPSIMQLLPASTDAAGLANISGFRLQGIANYDSPILQPWAADIVKHHGELIRAGELAPDAHTSCYPVGVPYSMILRRDVHLLQEPDRVTIIYANDNQGRTVDLNREHSDNVPPSNYGESVGWYEGNTLVVDTVGIKRTQFSVIDRFGTPHTEALHVVERYRIVRVNHNPALRIDVTVEDPGAFNMPWGGYMVYYDDNDVWWEGGICAENNRSGVWIPTDETPDF
jgi:hypothetical protein